MVKTYSIKAKERKVEAVGGKYCVVENMGDSTVFISTTSNIVPSAAGVIAIGPKSVKSLIVDPQYKWSSAELAFDWVADLYVTSTDTTTIEVSASVENCYAYIVNGDYDTSALINDNASSVETAFEIKLTQDIVRAFEIAEGDSMTIDLNGTTLSNKENQKTIINSGTLVIKDTSSDKSGVIQSNSKKTAVIQNTSTGRIIIESGVIEHTIEDPGCYTIDNAGILEINGGTVRASSGNGSLIRNIGPNAKTIVNGGLLTNKWITLKNDDEGTIIVNGGTIETTAAGGSGIQNWGTATINGGKITSVDGSAAIYQLTWSDDYASNLVFNNGTVNGTVMVRQYTDYTGSQVPKFVLNDGSINGDVLLGNNEGSVYGIAEFEVNGGTINGEVFTYDNNNDDGRENIITVNAGSILLNGKTVSAGNE